MGEKERREKVRREKKERKREKEINRARERGGEGAAVTKHITLMMRRRLDWSFRFLFMCNIAACKI